MVLSSGNSPAYALGAYSGRPGPAVRRRPWLPVTQSRFLPSDAALSRLAISPRVAMPAPVSW
jgi:hypothetical protein